MGHVHNTAVALGKKDSQDTFAAKRSQMSTSSKGTNAFLVIIQSNCSVSLRSNNKEFCGSIINYVQMEQVLNFGQVRELSA
jgi:hypothetical protein